MSSSTASIWSPISKSFFQSVENGINQSGHDSGSQPAPENEPSRKGSLAQSDKSSGKAENIPEPDKTEEKVAEQQNSAVQVNE